MSTYQLVASSMLIEIRSPVLRTDSIAFHEGLNVVLGDSNATNSIGKSTLLMVIDFALGGKDLLEYNTDLITELGHHHYVFIFAFEGEIQRFLRRTEEPSVVYRCDESLEPVVALGVEKYTAFLKAAYGVLLPDISFRSLVGLHMRVWGKQNLSVERPLHTVPNQANRSCVENLLKVYERYDSVRELADQLERLEARKRAFGDAKRHQIVNAIGKREYLRNQRTIDELDGELLNIKNHLAQFATSISEVVNREVLDLKTERDRLIRERTRIKGDLRRTSENLAENRHISNKNFRDLVTFFPSINTERLTQVEEFHSGVAKLLRVELQESRQQLEDALRTVSQSIEDIDERMAASLSTVDEPSALVDYVVRVSTKLREARKANESFEEEQQIASEVQQVRAALSREMTAVLDATEADINSGLASIAAHVFGEDRKSPVLTLRENSYTFEVYDDTGTGTAYSSLVMLDLTVFLGTQLPVIAHDSLLFKNIENDSVARLIDVYMQTKKQSFVALDEIEKYGPSAAATLREHSVIQLDDAHVLFVKDWRASKAQAPAP